MFRAEEEEICATGEAHAMQHWKCMCVCVSMLLQACLVVPLPALFVLDSKEGPCTALLLSPLLRPLAPSPPPLPWCLVLPEGASTLKFVPEALQAAPLQVSGLPRNVLRWLSGPAHILSDISGRRAGCKFTENQ
eukprot:scaffold37567_cov14-Tisochrysis_lutea.AAC.1